MQHLQSKGGGGRNAWPHNQVAMQRVATQRARMQQEQARKGVLKLRPQSRDYEPRTRRPIEGRRSALHVATHRSAPCNATRAGRRHHRNAARGNEGGELRTQDASQLNGPRSAPAALSSDTAAGWLRSKPGQKPMSPRVHSFHAFSIMVGTNPSAAMCSAAYESSGKSTPALLDIRVPHVKEACSFESGHPQWLRVFYIPSLASEPEATWINLP